MGEQGKVRHILGLSGGKDSAALAVYLKQKGLSDDMEYFFLDTGCELPEVYEFLDRMEVYLDVEIKRINSEKKFEDHLKTQVKMHHHENYLPSPCSRWCTKLMKIKPLEKFIGLDSVVSYIGIRADEKRSGYISKNTRNIKPIYPFKEDGIVREDVFRILRETVGIPSYYKWRSRSGCYFCFYQRIDEWAGLFEHHKDLFMKAMSFEKTDETTGNKYTWSEGLSLAELKSKIETGEYVPPKKKLPNATRSWQQSVIDDYENNELDDQACWLCSL
jgi:hypothetical protein